VMREIDDRGVVAHHTSPGARLDVDFVAAG
jgi:hypothetical protein